MMLSKYVIGSNAFKFKAKLFWIVMNKRRVKPEHVAVKIINAAYAVIYEVGLSNTYHCSNCEKQLSTALWVTICDNKASFTVACVKCSMS